MRSGKAQPLRAQFRPLRGPYRAGKWPGRRALAPRQRTTWRSCSRSSRRPSVAPFTKRAVAMPMTHGHLPDRRDRNSARRRPVRQPRGIHPPSPGCCMRTGFWTVDLDAKHREALLRNPGTPSKDFSNSRGAPRPSFRSCVLTGRNAGKGCYRLQARRPRVSTAPRTLTFLTRAPRRGGVNHAHKGRPRRGGLRDDNRERGRWPRAVRTVPVGIFDSRVPAEWPGVRWAGLPGLSPALTPAQRRREAPP